MYGIERVQYILGKKKAIIKDESDHIALLEDDDMLSVYLTTKVRRIQTSEDKPIVVPSWEETRLMCCHCDSEGMDLTYTVLKKNQTVKCDCGYHFKLIDQLDPFSKFDPQELIRQQLQEQQQQKAKTATEAN
jgi:hypothetical protein